MTETHVHTWITSSPEETRALGEVMGRSLIGGMTIGLIGPLGAGKTQLVKGIAAGNAAGETPEVTSPTFTLVNEYPGALALYHVDVYRLGDAPALSALGFEEWLRPDAVVVVEWADRVRYALPVETVWIELEPTDGDTGEPATVRRVSCRATGSVGKRFLDACKTDDR